jgi:hypothetical protein
MGSAGTARVSRPIVTVAIVDTIALSIAGAIVSTIGATGLTWAAGHGLLQGVPGLGPGRPQPTRTQTTTKARCA